MPGSESQLLYRLELELNGVGQALTSLNLSFFPIKRGVPGAPIGCSSLESRAIMSGKGL